MGEITYSEQELDRAMTCEIALDELKTMDDRLGFLSAEQRDALDQISITTPFRGFLPDRDRQQRLRRIRDRLSAAFPLDDENATYPTTGGSNAE